MIKIVYYEEILDNWGRREASQKGKVIAEVLGDVDNWTDDMIFEDSMGLRYHINELQGKEVIIEDIGIFIVPEEG